jgi:4-diphosphocytidyl-2-C-methyl-D-erythritol kinase
LRPAPYAIFKYLKPYTVNLYAITHIVKTFRIKAPAKLNIRLKVTGRRPDGYHELVSIMIPIDLFDLLELTVDPGWGIKLACEGTQLPNDESNLAFRAAQSFFSRTGIREAVSIKLIKNVPVAAGMGGGSSDAAATLLALNEMWSRPLSLPEMHDLAIGLGADVPFFLEGKPCLARGIGEILEPLDSWPKCWFVVVRPPIEVSTSWVYSNLKLVLTTDEYDNIKQTLSHVPISIPQILENDLERVTSATFPIVETIKKSLIQAGAQGALMTGSGPSVFGVFPSLDEALFGKKELVSQNLGAVFMATTWSG